MTSKFNVFKIIFKYVNCNAFINENKISTNEFDIFNLTFQTLQRICIFQIWTDIYIILLVCLMFFL